MIHKRRAGRKKFQETRHPIYKGVRQRNGKWVCELREPKNNKTRVWLGTFSHPHMAAIAYDVAALAFRGENASLNFPQAATSLPRLNRETNSIKTIQIAAMQAAEKHYFFIKKEEENVEAKDSINIIINNNDSSDNNSASSPHHDDDEYEFPLDCCLFGSSSTSIIEKSELEEEDSRRFYWDEEEVFDMPGLMNSLAEGLIITPPALQSGFSWVGGETTVDLTLWGD